MHPETRDLLRAQAEHPETLDQRIARLRAVAPDPEQTVIEQALPSAHDEVLVIVDLVQLHDLVHAAASSYLHTLSSMGRERARQHADRIADQAERIAWGSDYLQRGADPRG